MNAGHPSVVTRRQDSGRSRYRGSTRRWPVIQGTGGASRIRPARTRQERRRSRDFYFFSATPTVIAFLDIYTKNAKDDLTGADKRDIRAAITEIRAALR